MVQGVLFGFGFGGCRHGKKRTTFTQHFPARNRSILFFVRKTRQLVSMGPARFMAHSHSSIFPRCLPALAALLLLAACHRQPAAVSGPITQRGYLWQRDWTPAVGDAASEADRRLDGLVLLGAEIVWENGKPRVIAANIPWAAVRALKKPCAIGLRIAPFTGTFARDDANVRAIVAEAKSLLADAAAGGVELKEFQLDFDCAQRRLADYREWIAAVKPAVRPVRFVITALPSWLDEGEFRALAGDADGYVLQVHSVPTARESGRESLCDPALARKWVAKAAKIGLHFRSRCRLTAASRVTMAPRENCSV